MIILEVCFVAAVVGTVVSYVIFQKRNYNVMIGGIFGIAMLAVFGTWLIGEMIEAFILDDNTAAIYLNSSVMIGFAIFIFARFFLLRRNLQLEARTMAN